MNQTPAQLQSKPHIVPPPLIILPPSTRRFEAGSYYFQLLKTVRVLVEQSFRKLNQEALMSMLGGR